jgi:UDP-N-acetylglucosamine acyltransferase
VTNFHRTAIIDRETEIGDDVEIGPYCVIEANVRIGNGCKIKPHVHIAGGTRLGEYCQVFTGAVLGTIPQDLKFQNEETTLEIGAHTVIREFATLNRGTHERGKTTIGSHCLLMAYSHVAHDCDIGNSCILANAATLAGHVVIEDYVGFGGMVPVHQFVRVGKHSFIGGGYRVAKDVPPYILAMGEPLTYAGLNSVGLRRRGFSEETLAALKHAYRILFKGRLNVSQAVQHIRESGELIPEVQEVLAFIERSERGIIG